MLSIPLRNRNVCRLISKLTETTNLDPNNLIVSKRYQTNPNC
jgi:hypothetical protein